MTTTQSVRTDFAADHDRLDGLFAEYRTLKRTDPARAKECFKEFKFGLQRHIIWEEQILFPRFEFITGMPEGSPTARSDSLAGWCGAGRNALALMAIETAMRSTR